MAESGPDPIVIKKYANRRLYDTESSAYITLDRLAEMVRQKRQFKVIDARTGEDITRSVLAQIILDEESRGAEMLPVSFLRQLISLYGDSMQSVVPHYLEASIDALQHNQKQLRDAMAGAIAHNPFAEIARRNMEMFTAGAAKRRDDQSAGAAKRRDDQSAGRAEIEALKAELAELQRKIDRLS